MDVMLYNLRQIANSTLSNPKGLGLVDISYPNLRIKVLEGKLVPTQSKSGSKGYRYHLFSKESISNFNKTYGRS